MAKYAGEKLLVITVAPVSEAAIASVRELVDVEVRNRAEGIPDEVWADVTMLVTFSMLPSSTRIAPRLRWIQLGSAGYDRVVGAPFLRERAVPVTTASGVHSTVIAEHVIMFMLSFMHQLPQRLDETRTRHVWASLPPVNPFNIRELRNGTIGVVGYGAIGREVARMAKQGFGMRVTAATSRGTLSAPPDYALPHTGDPEGRIPDKVYATSDRNSFAEFLRSADVVVLACPLTAATKGLVGAEELAEMKHDALLVNIARGEVVDQPALVEALARKTIGGAALDVAYPEPLPDGHALFGFDNCIITPHTSGRTQDYMESVMDITKLNIARLMNNEPLINKVTF